MLLAQLEAVRACVAAAADASQQASEDDRLREVDARRKLLCKGIKGAALKGTASKPHGETDAKVKSARMEEAKAKGGPAGRQDGCQEERAAAGAAEGRTAAGAVEAALHKKRRKHDPEALFAADPVAVAGTTVKPEPT